MATAEAITGSESGAELQAKIDSGDSYTIDAVAVTRFLTRYLENQLKPEELEQIGDLLEGAEFVEYAGPGSDGLIAQVVFEFSTPQTKGKISKAAAERWIRLLAP
jgi:hypothetical protein